MNLSEESLSIRVRCWNCESFVVREGKLCFDRLPESKLCEPEMLPRAGFHFVETTATGTKLAGVTTSETTTCCLYCGKDW